MHLYDVLDVRAQCRIHGRFGGCRNVAAGSDVHVSPEIEQTDKRAPDKWNSADCGLDVSWSGSVTRDVLRLVAITGAHTRTRALIQQTIRKKEKHAGKIGRR